MTTNNPVTIAEDYAMTQYMPGGQIDLMMGRGTTGSVYSWFGKIFATVFRWPLKTTLFYAVDGAKIMSIGTVHSVRLCARRT